MKGFSKKDIEGLSKRDFWYLIEYGVVDGEHEYQVFDEVLLGEKSDKKARDAAEEAAEVCSDGLAEWCVVSVKYVTPKDYKVLHKYGVV